MSTIIQPTRTFSMNGVLLPDPSPDLQPDEVLRMYSANYPHLASALIEGPEHDVKSNTLAYSFVPPAAKTKG